jgi:hypothetical protein
MRIDFESILHSFSARFNYFVFYLIYMRPVRVRQLQGPCSVLLSVMVTVLSSPMAAQCP